jgi:CelD/BcsL family acetyltransferase involved in cellulose biosynthesis
MLKTNLIHGSKAFDILKDEWDELVGRSMTNTPFQSLAYQRSWWDNLGEGDLFTITIRESTDNLIAIGCFYLKEGTVYFNGCIEETDYLDLLVQSNLAEATWEVILDCMDSSGFPNWSNLDLCNVPENSPTNIILPELARWRGYRFNVEEFDVCPVITLPDTFDAYLANLSKKQRHEIRRKMRRAETAGAQVSLVESDDSLASEVDSFLRLLASSSDSKNAWLTESRKAIFHEIAQAAGSSGTLQLMFLEINGKKAAGLFNFAYRNRIWVYNSGLDPNEFGYLSAGVVLTARSIEKAIEDGRSEFDFLRGSEAYKYRFGAGDTVINRLFISK